MICTHHLLVAPTHLQRVSVGPEPTLESCTLGGRGGEAAKQQWLVGPKEAHQGLDTLLSGREKAESYVRP